MSSKDVPTAEPDDLAEAPQPGEPIQAADLLEHIARQMRVAEGQQIVHVEHLASRAAQYAEISRPLPDLLQQALTQMGIAQLYDHQVESIERVRRGENIVVCTATSSGKTLCYNLPIIERILQERSSKAIYIYPINALINDQLKSLFRINLALGKDAIGIARYTGSLNSEQRRLARERSPHIWLTNPEMLHLSFLLWRQNWEDLWRNLRFVVIDEVHTYRGVFGSNVAQLLRRMLRMAEHYGSSPQFICCSATIANPQELVERLTGRPFTVIDHDGAGSGRKLFALWNPPLQSDDGSNRRRSHSEESVDLLLHCVQANYNTIVFARARGLTERMLRMGRALSEDRSQSQLMGHISSYRAGYLAEEREDIENKLKTGVIKGIITTNALEMGIDIGGLDAAILSGYPGTIMSTWQQAGRAGRRGRDALIFLVASQNPLDQYYVNNPREFFGKPHELAIVDLDNQHIRLKHLLCAARELPYASAEINRLPVDVQALLEELRERELLEPCALEDGSEGLQYPRSGKEIHFRVSLRSASHETYHILDANHNEIGTIEPPNAYRETHPGAIYQHGGDDYRVTFLDRRQQVVHVREEHVPHYTRASSAITVKIENVLATRELMLEGNPLRIGLGEVLVEETIYSYQELALGSDELIKRVNLDYPLTLRLHTTAMWLALPPALEASILQELPPCAENEGAEEGGGNPFVEGLHGVEHLVTGVMPLLVMCDRRDVDGFHHPRHADLGAASVFIYDAYEGGIGLAEIAYARAAELLRLAYETVSRCRCASGCPSCIQSGVCRLRNESLNKAAASAILVRLATVEDQEVDSELVESRAQEVLASRLRASQPGKARALQDVMERMRRSDVLRGLDKAQQVPAQARFAEGDLIEHSPYGRGVVLSVRMDGAHELVTVRFIHRSTVREIDASKGALRKLERH
jgi:DEAD/DEAH box helicase domain-containing protein